MKPATSLANKSNMNAGSAASTSVAKASRSINNTPRAAVEVIWSSACPGRGRETAFGLKSMQHA